MKRLFHNRKVMITAITLVLVLMLSQTTFAQRLIFESGLFDRNRALMFGDFQIRASDYKDGTIILIKPIATGVGEGRYEAGDIVAILDGQEMYQRFGDTDFLGYEEKSKLIPLYLDQKLTPEQKEELLASEYEESNNNQVTITKQETNSNPSFIVPSPLEGEGQGEVKASSPASSVILSPAARGEGSRGASVENGILRSAQDDKEQGDVSSPSPRFEERAGGEVKKMTRRRTYGVDYTLVLSDKDILKIRQEKALNKIPEVKFEEIINKNTKLSYADKMINDQFSIINQLSMINDQNRQRTANGVIEKWIIRKLIDNWSLKIENCGSESVVCLPKHLAIMEKALKQTKRLAAIIVPNVRAATESVKTVDTGGYADYTSLNAWEAGEQDDLTVSDTIAIAKCQHKTATSTADTAGVDIAGWNTDATRYIKIWTDPSEDHRHNGKWDNGKYNQVVTLTSQGSCIIVEESYVSIDGLQCSVAGSIDDTSYSGIWVYGGTECQISNSIFKKGNTDSHEHNAIWFEPSDQGGGQVSIIGYAWNNVIYDFAQSADSAIGGYVPSTRTATIYAFNNTIQNCYEGIDSADSGGTISMLAKNNIVQDDAGGSCYAGSNFHASSGNNVSDDGTQPGSSGINGEVTFADEASDDFHLYATDSAAQNAGTSSVSEIGFTTDIDGATRPIGGVWDIGADEQSGKAAMVGVNPYSRAGTDGLVGYWSFDGATMGTTSATDLSGNGNTGWMYSLPQKVSGSAGQALWYDGIDDYFWINDPGASVLDISSQLTLSAWVYLARNIATDTRVPIIGKMDIAEGDPVNYFLSIEDDTNVEYLGYGVINISGTPGFIRSNGPVSVNKWVHVAVVDDDVNSSCELYIDGVKQSKSIIISGDPAGYNFQANNHPFYIGVDDTYHFPGRIDEVLVYNRPLSGDEIKELYRAGNARTMSNTTAVQSGAPTGGLAGHWTLDSANIDWDTNTAADASGAGNSGHLINMSTTTSPVSGKINEALVFDSDNDYISVANESDFDFNYNSPFSVSLWMKANAADTSNQAIVTKASDSSPWNGWHFMLNASCTGDDPGKIMFALTNNGGGPEICLNTANDLSVNDGNWHYYTLVYDGSGGAGGVSIFEDNIAMSIKVGWDNLGTNSILNDIAVNIGARGGGSPTYGQIFAGTLDDVRIYSRALTRKEIKTLYQLQYLQKSGLDIGLVGAWTFDGSDIDWKYNRVYDLSGYFNNGTMYNMSTSSSGVSGQIGQALRFDGCVGCPMDDYVDAGSDAILDNMANITVSAWIRPKSGGNEGGGAAIVNKDNGNDNGWGFYISEDGYIKFYVNYATQDLNKRSDGGAVQFNTWQHVAVTFASGTTQTLHLNTHIFVNGAEPTYDQLIDGQGSRDDDSGNNFFIGKGMNADHFDGYIDDVRIYNRALSASEISDLYRQGTRRMKLRPN